MDVPPSRAAPIAGKYQLVRMLGRGGMGSVWEATHVSIGTHVAIKFIENAAGRDAEAQRRFHNEACAAAKLQSRHVIQVYDHGVTESGEPYLVMELLRGEPLDARLTKVGRLSLRETAGIVAQICRALTRAHAEHIVHRDLKPENIFLVRELDSDEEVVKVVDFGIAKFSSGGPGPGSGTQTGALLGTPYYMSPEQAHNSKTVDHRSDLWAVGVLTYRCVVGKLPFDSDSFVDLMFQIVNGPSPVPSKHAPGLPDAFDAWFAKAVARSADERFQSPAEMAQTLAAMAGTPEAALVTGVSTDPVRSSLENSYTIPATSAPLTTVPKGFASTIGRVGSTRSRKWIAMGAVAAVIGVAAVYASVRRVTSRAPETIQANEGAAPASAETRQVAPGAVPSASTAGGAGSGAASAVASVAPPAPVASVVATAVQPGGQPKSGSKPPAAPGAKPRPAATPAATDPGF
jgi:eukaryotic-like serine/threonine-protein kinase